MSFAGTWTELQITILSEISQTYNDKNHVFLHMQNLNLKQRQQQQKDMNNGKGGVFGVKHREEEGDKKWWSR
jgi:hypothetical protein